MLIGIDMIGSQSPGSGARGIGRYVRSFVSALLAADTGNQYVLYYHDAFLRDVLATTRAAQVRTVSRDSSRNEAGLGECLARLVEENPDRLDLLLLTSPFEEVHHAGYRLPARPSNGLKLAAILYDLIRFLFPKQYLTDPFFTGLYYQAMERLKRYDALLAISEATREDALRVLGMQARRIHNICCATDSAFFVPAPATGRCPPELQRLGIVKPFVFNLGNIDSRKNLRGLIAAFSLLPTDLRARHQLVIGCHVPADQAVLLRSEARDAGIEESLVLTGAVPDSTLRVLYQHCQVFAFPSFYEGFGLPLLEAMSCGAAVIAADSSSQPEVVGDAGLLVNAGNPADIAEKIQLVLKDEVLARSLRMKGLAQSKKFGWDRTAARAQDVFSRLDAPVSASGRPARIKPRLAVFAPLRPQTDEADAFPVDLLDELRQSYAVDVYQAPGHLPNLALASADFGFHDYRLFARRSAALGYRGILYQMGKSPAYHFVKETLARHPGVVTCRGLSPEDIGSSDMNWGDGPVGNLLRQVPVLVVEGPGWPERIQEIHPGWSGNVVIVPPGTKAVRLSACARDAARSRMGLPARALVFACCELDLAAPQTDQVMRAFALVARVHDTAMLMISSPRGLAREERDLVARHGLGARVRLVCQPEGACSTSMSAVADIGIGVARFSRTGDTARLLEFLGAGVPILVRGAAASMYPDGAISKISSAGAEVADLAEGLLRLANEPSYREKLSWGASKYVEENHSWRHVASCYARVIDQAFETSLKAAS